MKLGFTGTRHGMTDAQKHVFGQFIQEQKITEFHHGDCEGADDEAADIFDMLMPDCLIVEHPPLDETHRAFNECARQSRPAKSHFARNRDIVNECDQLFAAPQQAEHQPRGGTWYTIDFALKTGTPTHVCGPDGVIESTWPVTESPQKMS